jgi:hypothetical protein
MVSLQYDLATDYENEAFFGAFFKFIEAASLEDTDAISIHSNVVAGYRVKVVTFQSDRLALDFETYWTQRRKWLGL